MRDKRGFRFDIFLGKVCGKLRLSENMKSRAEHYGTFGNLKIFLLSREDIFIFKGITERERDLDDMAVLYRKGLDHNIIIKEIEEQSKDSPQEWGAFIFVKLEELEEKYKVSIPWKREFARKVESVVERIIIDKIKNGINTVEKLSSDLKQPEYFIRRELNRLITKGIIGVDKTKKPYIYFVKN